MGPTDASAEEELGQLLLQQLQRQTHAAVHAVPVFLRLMEPAPRAVQHDGIMARPLRLSKRRSPSQQLGAATRSASRLPLELSALRSAPGPSQGDSPGEHGATDQQVKPREHAVHDPDCKHDERRAREEDREAPEDAASLTSPRESGSGGVSTPRTFIEPRHRLLRSVS